MALYMCQVLHVVDFVFGVSPDGNCAYVHYVFFCPTLGQSDEPSDLRGSLSPTSVYVYNTWQSQAVTHPIMNRARRSFLLRATLAQLGGPATVL